MIKRKEVIKQVKLFRILGRSIRDALKSVCRNFSLSIASVICTVITLILVAIAIVVTCNVNYATKALEKELTIVVYINNDIDDDKISVIETQIKRIDNVEATEYKSNEEWKLEMKNYSEAFKNTLDYLENNPLLDSFVVTVKDVNDLAPTTREILKIDGVKSANYGEGMVEEIISIFKAVKVATIVMVVALVIVTAFLIGNTIRLTIFSRRSEIEIMRLVGSSNISIKLPFVFEGFFLGMIGSLIPIILTVYAYIIIFEKVSISKTFGMIELIKPMPFVFYVSAALLLIGSLVGMFGSARAVRKYLKI